MFIPGIRPRALGAALCGIGLVLMHVNRGISQTTRTVRADTTVFLTTGNGSWGPPRSAIEALRIDGRNGSHEFGSVGDILALGNGGVAVFDIKGVTGPELKIFDGSGRLIRTLGRRGAGPGEYGAEISFRSLAESSTGELLMMDAANNRVNRWKSDGQILPAIVPQMHIGGYPPRVVSGPIGSLFVAGRVPAKTGDGASPAGPGYYRLGDNGKVLDTLRVPDRSAVPAFSDFMAMTLFQPLKDGGRVSVRTDRMAVMLYSATGKGTVLMEHPREPVKFLPQERDELVAFTKYMAPHMGLQVPDIPANKPLFSELQVSADEATFWLRLRGVGQPTPPSELLKGSPEVPPRTYREPIVYGAFRRDGTWLGEVRFPQNTVAVSFGRSVAWGLLRDDGDLVTLVKWNLPK